MASRRLGVVVLLLALSTACSTTQQCREALTSELQRLGRIISTSGTRLNKLVTRSP